MINIYTDGACLLNYTGGLAIGLCGFYDQTREVFVIDDRLSFGSNSYLMELQAVHLALGYVNSDAVIFCDSMQVIDNITTKGKNPNTEFERKIRRLFELKNKVCNIQIRWVKSHSDNIGNNIIDQKLEQEMCRMIKESKPIHRDMIIEKVQTRYEFKGCFESFSQGFFDELLKIF
jgi:ribonuclease HI